MKVITLRSEVRRQSAFLLLLSPWTHFKGLGKEEGRVPYLLQTPQFQPTLNRIKLLYNSNRVRSRRINRGKKKHVRRRETFLQLPFKNLVYILINWNYLGNLFLCSLYWNIFKLLSTFPQISLVLVCIHFRGWHF